MISKSDFRIRRLGDQRVVGFSALLFCFFGQETLLQIVSLSPVPARGSPAMDLHPSRGE